MTWLILALIVAILTSVQDILSKKLVKKADALVVTWGWWFFSLPFLYAAILIRGIPEIQPSFWKAFIIATVLLTVAVIYYIKALEAGDLSLTVPMLSFTPLLLLITSPMILGESIPPTGMAGVLFIVVGSYLLNFKDIRYGFLQPFKALVHKKGPRYMLIVAVIFSVSANFDKVGTLASDPFCWIMLLNTAVALILTGLLLRQKVSVSSQIRPHIRMLLIIGTVNAVALITQMMAIQLIQVPYLIAIKRTSVILSALFGFIILKEQGMKERLAGIILMVVGVFLISYA